MYKLSILVEKIKLAPLDSELFGRTLRVLIPIKNLGAGLYKLAVTLK